MWYNYDMKIQANNFNIKQIAQSGQCFRFNPIEDGRYRVIAYSKYVDMWQDKDIIELSCSEDEWDSTWKMYFDMDTDYGRIGEMIYESGDEYLIKAYENGNGVRILRQDLWETIVSFMISQNNNIPRIKSSIDKICRLGGRSLTDGVYDFPKPGAIDPDAFMDKTLGLGYRNEYLRDMYRFAENNPDQITSLKELSYDEARAELMKFKGIGRKVADCICLYGLHHVEAFPIDTHIKRIIADNYPNGFDTKRFPHVAGIIQQFMFYYDL